MDSNSTKSNRHSLWANSWADFCEFVVKATPCSKLIFGPGVAPYGELDTDGVWDYKSYLDKCKYYEI